MKVGNKISRFYEGQTVRIRLNKDDEWEKGKITYFPKFSINDCFVKTENNEEIQIDIQRDFPKLINFYFEEN